MSYYEYPNMPYGHESKGYGTYPYNPSYYGPYTPYPAPYYGGGFRGGYAFAIAVVVLVLLLILGGAYYYYYWQ